MTRLALLSAFAAVAVFAQVANQTALVGTVTDGTGKSVPGAPVSAPACITFERSDAPAPAGKSGVMLRGEGTIAGAGHWREAAIEVSRASWWVGRRTGSSDQR